MIDLRAARPGLAVEFVAPLVLAALGASMLGLALTQPAWIEGRIGPGLFARWLSGAVVGTSLLWLVASLAQRRSAACARAAGLLEAPSPLAGLGLLTGVALFALALPASGLVASCALTSLVVSWGAGERSWRALTSSALAGGAIALALGLTLLPPGTRLWPPGL